MNIAFPAIGMLHSSQNATEMPHFYYFVLKGMPSKDANWLENVENVWIFPVAGFVCLCLFFYFFNQYSCYRRNAYLFQIWASEDVLM